MQCKPGKLCRTILMLLVVAALSPLHAQVYRHVDAEGRVSFSDKPPEEGQAEAVQLPPTNAMPAAQATETPAAGTADSNADQAFNGYSRFEMTSPEQDEILGWDVTTASLTAELSPPLQPGHTIQFYLDGRPLGKPGTTLFRLVSSLERGSHSAEARVRDEKARTLAITPHVSFHVRRHIDQGGTLLDPDLYPYDAGGARSPRGARSPGGAGGPEEPEGDIGAGSAPGAGSPGQRVIRRPLH